MISFTSNIQSFKLRICLLCILNIYCFYLIPSCSNIEQDKINVIEEYKRLRNEKLNQPRNVIHNNDGNDAVFYPINEKFSIKNLMDKRTSGLIGTDVATISYTTITSGFGNFTHNTKIGEILTEHGFEFGILNQSRNITSEMLVHGTDPLKANVKFAHENGFEIFWSNRINDTHDSGHREDKPHYLWTDFKEKHPEYLFGSIGEHLPNGTWSSLDFDHEEVRDLCVQFYKEVCENYDVDGVELDFFRHLELFETVGRGGSASQNQLNKLTDMIRQVRKVTERVGMQRGKPILILVRIPTSVEYAKMVGIDIKRWIDANLVDIVVGSGYFRLNFWENFAKIKNNKNVKFYAGLSESRVKEEHPLLVRQQNSVYRARASAAWEAGLDGMYSFNEYNTRVKYLSEIGDPEKIRSTNNLYFVTYRDYPANRYLNDGNNYFKTTRFSPSPGNHRQLQNGPFSFDIELGNESQSAKVYIALMVAHTNPEKLTVKLNDYVAKFNSALDNELLIFRLDQKAIHPGINELYIESEENEVDKNKLLKDAAIFFCRDTEDIEMRDLINLCVLQ